MVVDCLAERMLCFLATDCCKWSKLHRTARYNHLPGTRQERPFPSNSTKSAPFVFAAPDQLEGLKRSGGRWRGGERSRARQSLDLNARKHHQTPRLLSAPEKVKKLAARLD